MYNFTSNPNNELLDEFKKYLASKQIVYEDVLKITFSLVMGTLHALKTDETRSKVWKFIQDIFVSKFVTHDSN